MGVFSFFFKNGGLSKPGNPHAYDEEFSTEIYDKTFSTASMPPYNSYINNGIRISETENPIKLIYDGLLPKNGAADTYAVVGYGNNLRWENIEYFPMRRVSHQVFEASIPVRRSGNINIAFKDGADHWDNNSGMNYTFDNHFYKGGQ